MFFVRHDKRFFYLPFGEKIPKLIIVPQKLYSRPWHFRLRCLCGHHHAVQRHLVFWNQSIIVQRQFLFPHWYFRPRCLCQHYQHFYAGCSAVEQLLMCQMFEDFCCHPHVYLNLKIKNTVIGKYQDFVDISLDWIMVEGFCRWKIIEWNFHLPNH